MKNRKLGLTVICVALLLPAAFCQNNEPVNLSVIPPSPGALSFMKFGEIPVGTYTGIPQIDIPIYHYEGKYIKLPVSLKYHAGGIRVEEIASNVGLGWALSAGGSVSRTVRGLADDMAVYGYLAAGALENCNGEIPLAQYPYTKCHDYYRGAIDSEQDLFYVNANNLSFKFTLSKAGVPELDAQSKIKVERNTGPLEYNCYGNITEWIVTDESGNKYTFSEKEYTKSNSYPSTFTPHSPKHIVTSWYLTKIEAPFSFETIDYEYDSYNYTYNQSMSESLSPEYTYTYSWLQLIAKRIKKIITPNSTINLTYSSTNRCDLIGDKPLTSISVDYLEEQIRLFNFSYKYMTENSLIDFSSCNPTGSSQLDKRLILTQITEQGKNPYEFFYNVGLPSRDSKSQDHWGFYNGQSNTTLIPKTYFYTACFDVGYQVMGDANRRPDPELVKRGSLIKIVYPTKGSTSFEYEINRAENKMLEYDLIDNIYTLDGFSAISTQIEINREQLPKTNLTFKLYIMPAAFNDPICGIKALILRNGKPVTSVSFTRSEFNQGINTKSILSTLPDGIYEFTVDYLRKDLCPNVPGDPFMLELKYSNESVSSSKNAGGIRIKRIVDSPNPPGNFNEMVRWYEYTNIDGTSSGLILHHPVYLTRFEHDNLIDCFFGSLSSSSRVAMGNTQGSPVGYSRVVEHLGDLSENGYTEFWYTSPLNYPDHYGFSGSEISNFPFVPASSFENCRGLLTKKLLWDKNGVLVEKLVNTYDITSTFGDGLTNVKVGIDESWGDGTIVLIGESYTNFQIRSNLISTRNVNYFAQNDSIVSVKNFTYGSSTHLFPTSIDYTDSKGDFLETKIKYPSDINAGIYASLVSKNMLSNPIEQTSLRNSKITASKLTTYKTVGANYLPGMIYSLETTTPLTSFNYFNGSTMDSRYGSIPQTEFNTFDDKGNITQYTQSNGQVVTLFWAYNKFYPVARIISGSALSVNPTLRENISAHVYTNSDNKSSIDVDVTFLKTQLSSYISNMNNEVTIFTYKPNIGMTSETDPNGITTYYEYDSLGRVNLIRDHDGHILKTFEYQYKQ
jgi:YD repeat-containing protein